MKPAVPIDSGFVFPASNRWIIAIAVMSSAIMEVLDTSVVNVSLPHIAGSLSATVDEATWVLTSYIVANAIILPITGWLANYFGRKRLLMTVVTGFTVSSALCGLAPNLPTLVERRSQVHQSALVAHTSEYSDLLRADQDWLRSLLEERGANAAVARREALALLYRRVQRQARLLSFLDAFRVLGFLFLVIVPVVFLMRRRVSEEAAVRETQ
jgi:MFS family permease